MGGRVGEMLEVIGPMTKAVAGFWEEGSSPEDGKMRREWRGKS